MVIVTINQKEVGRITTIPKEFKSYHNAFSAAQTMARDFWQKHSGQKFPVDNLVGTKWHFEPSTDVTMDVVFESEELKKHQLYLLCALDDLSRKFGNSISGKYDRPSLRLVEDEGWSGLPALEFASYNNGDDHVVRYNPKTNVVDYRIWQALRRAELCYSRKYQKVAVVYITDEDNFPEPKYSLNSPEWPSLTQEERFKIKFLTRFFNQALNILVSDYDVHSYRQVAPEMKKTLSVDAEGFSDMKTLEILPEFLRGKKKILDLATVLNADRKCGTSFATRMEVSDDDVRSAENVCSLCSMENVPPSEYPHGFWVGQEVFKYF